VRSRPREGAVWALVWAASRQVAVSSFLARRGVAGTTELAASVLGHKTPPAVVGRETLMKP
jgi:hypothetical protein